jgi:two-component sensor histidine kinase
MKATRALESIRQRAKRPFSWSAVLSFGLLWNLARWLILPQPLHWEEALLPFVLGILSLVISPFPWQWTGDDRPMGNLFRGLAQAVPWNLAGILAVFLLLPFHGPPEGSGGGGRGPGRGRGPWAAEAPAEAPRTISPRVLILAAAGFSFALILGLVLAQKEGAEALEEETRRGLHAAQAKALQSQMSPHVLFNLISGLSEMARENPQATEESLVALADLLRRLLNHSARSLAPLSEERALVEAYLALEQVRLGSRLQVRWEWDGSLDAVEAQPLLLQPLVENAIKHGIVPSREGGELVISLRQDGDRAVLRVANTGAPLRTGKEGIGLSNLRQRLGLLGGSDVGFTLGTSAGWTVAEVRAPVSTHV